jgi:hypothetical protein
MIVDTILTLLMYALVAVVPGWAMATRLPFRGSERLLAAVVLSLLLTYLVAWTVYVLNLPHAVMWVFPLASVAALVIGWRSIKAAWRDPEIRELVWAQTLVTGWSVGWLALVVTYSGGGWVMDWLGHWQRTAFFLDHGPREILFNGFDPLTSRPPLGNVVIGAWLVLTRYDFAHYQLAMTFFSSLVFLPAALLARRFGVRHAPRILAVLLMVSPMFVQNATFAWTKLPAAFFTLAALWFYLQHFDSKGMTEVALFAAALGCALLTHYSAGPYAVVLALVWLLHGWKSRFGIGWWRSTAVATLIGGAVLATWFAWALGVYGARGTFLTNTTVSGSAPTLGAQLWTGVLNVRDTLVPFFLRSVDEQFFAQANPWGWWRDWFFSVYQLNLLYAFGSAAGIVLIVALWKYACAIKRRVSMVWTLAIAAIIILGVLVNTDRDIWGLTHICLQSIILLGLAFLAAKWPSLSRPWQWVIMLGAAIDLILGIALQFGCESFLIDEWAAGHSPPVDTIWNYSRFAAMNLSAKLQYNFTFFGDQWAGRQAIVFAALVALFVRALLNTRRAHSAVGPGPRAKADEANDLSRGASPRG